MAGIQPVTYEGDTMSKIFGIDNVSQLSHVTSMMPIISSFNKKRKQGIWDDTMRGLSTKIPRHGRTQGQMSVDEAKQAVDFMRPYFTGIDLSSEEIITQL